MLTNFADKYGLFVMGGAIGAVIHRLRTKMTFKRFLASVVISVFVALCTGAVCRDYFHLQDSVVYVLCGVSGVFSDTILDEIQELIKNVSNIVKSRYSTSSE